MKPLFFSFSRPRLRAGGASKPHRLSLPLVLGVALLLAQVAQGQPGSGGPGPGTVTTPDPASVPLDGGASLLLASGVGYAIRRLQQRR